MHIRPVGALLDLVAHEAEEALNGLLGESTELGVGDAGRGHTGDRADHRVRDRRRKLGHDIDDTPAPLQRLRVAVHHVTDLAVHALDATRRKPGAEQLALLGVRLAVERHQPVVVDPAEYRALGWPLVMRPDTPVAGYALVIVEVVDVLIAGDQPQILIGQISDRVLLAQAMQQREGVLAGLGRVELDFERLGGGHGGTPGVGSGPGSGSIRPPLDTNGYTRV